MTEDIQISHRQLYAPIRKLDRSIRISALLGIGFAALGVVEAMSVLPFIELQAHTTLFTAFGLTMLCINLLTFRWCTPSPPWKISLVGVLVAICVLSILSILVPGFPLPMNDLLSPSGTGLFHGRFGLESAVFIAAMGLAGLCRRRREFYGELAFLTGFAIVAFNYVQILYGVKNFGGNTGVFTLLSQTAILYGVLSIYASRRFFRVLFLNSWIGATARTTSAALVGLLLFIGTFIAVLGHLPQDFLEIWALFTAFWIAILCMAVVHLSNLHEAADKKRRRAVRELLRLAHTDRLTGLLNRAGAEQALDGIWDDFRQHGTRYGAVLIDLDHFKALNDTFGHAAGDLALKNVGAVLAMQSRVNDVTARWGGEEFLMVMPLSDETSVGEIAERLRVSIERCHQQGSPDSGSAETVTASIGATELHGSDSSLKVAIRRADKMLYRAKAAGRNCVVEARAVERSSPDTVSNTSKGSAPRHTAARRPAVHRTPGGTVLNS